MPEPALLLTTGPALSVRSGRENEDKMLAEKYLTVSCACCHSERSVYKAAWKHRGRIMEL